MKVKVKEGQFVISHSESGKPMVCDTFDEAMDEWFEGSNIPYKVVGGKLENFDIAYQRVKDWIINET
jgi:hypothetical protein